MVDVENLQKILNAAQKQAGEESSLLLGQNLALGESDSLQTNKLSFFSGMDDPIFVAAVEVREDYQGTFYMIFSLRDAILLSSMLLGIPPARISEKRKLAIMEPDDHDAFGEIMNQVIGSFNSVFKPRFPSKIHLKLLGAPKKFVPGVDEASEQEPVPEGEYLLFRSQLQMDGMEMDRLDVFIPLALGEMLMPGKEAEPEPEPEVAAEAEAEEKGAGEAAQPAQAVEQTVVILDDDSLDREHVKGFLTGTGIKLVEASLADDIRELFTEGKANVAVIGVSDTDDRELALCIKINSFCHGRSVPIILCAKQWTRTAVLKALKYGAKDIIMKPYTEEELVSKVKKYLNAA